jgi:hypothetical protein
VYERRKRTKKLIITAAHAAISIPITKHQTIGLADPNPNPYPIPPGPKKPIVPPNQPLIPTQLLIISIPISIFVSTVHKSSTSNITFSSFVLSLRLTSLQAAGKGLGGDDEMG